MSDFYSQDQETNQTATAVMVRPKNKRKNKPKREPKYHVILWNDEVHTFEYVVRMLQVLFGYPPERGWQLAREVDSRGKAIVFTSSLDRAEVKRDQILAFGPDPLMFESTGPLIATLEKDAENE
ncbi:MAG: ATP-dependent Clp protease adaptor ClpS [Planctomycetaceae bacterium]|jgi:ATP-dependent Clp protease adaptor protein ClpS|nr:ATP-dependent Clp protease adaptor ClpS [Planctomycetaceae bacterium]